MVPILAGTFGCRNNCLEYIGISGPLRNINAVPISFVKGEEALRSFKDTIPHCSHNAYEPFAKRIDPVETGFVGEVVTECPQAAEIMKDTETKFERVGAY